MAYINNEVTNTEQEKYIKNWNAAKGLHLEKWFQTQKLWDGYFQGVGTVKLEAYQEQETPDEILIGLTGICDTVTEISRGLEKYQFSEQSSDE